MKKHIVTGRNYGYVDNKLTEFWYLKLKCPHAEVSVCSQYGWETGCKETDHAVLYGVSSIRCLEKGSPLNCSKWEFLCDNIEMV